jgi:hypothetical protein
MDFDTLLSILDGIWTLNSGSQRISLAREF